MDLMSATVFPRKRIPLSVSLGITTKLSGDESLHDEMFSSLSFEKQKTLLCKSSLAIVCKESLRDKNNELAVFLAVRRVYGLKNKTKLPVVFTVKNQYVGKKTAEELARHSVDYKLYNMIYSLKDKLDEELIVKEFQQADFILITYVKLRELVLKDALPATEQIIFINPLTKRNCHREVITLDDIKDGLIKHKRKKPHFTYILDAQSFPVLEKKDYQHLLAVDDCLFFGCVEKPFNTYKSKLDSLKRLFDEHYWFFVLRELFRGRNSLDGLFERFKNTLTYKLDLYSNNIIPQNLKRKGLDIHFRNLREVKTDIDKKVKGSINKTLLLFSKKPSKTIIGTKSYEEGQDKQTIIWDDPTETPGFFPLIEKKKDRNYYLTKLGYILLTSTTNIVGAKKSLSDLLLSMANTLFRKKGPHPKFSIEEILRCYSLLIGSNTFELPSSLKECLNTDINCSEQELLTQLNKYITREFGYIRNDYSNYAALEFLDAFKDYMDDQATLLYKKLKEFTEKKKRRREKNLPQAILDAVKSKPLFIGEISRKVRAGYTKTAREAAKLEETGLLECITITRTDGSTRLKYCQPEVLKLFPHLKKICAICLLYKKRFGKCALFEILAGFGASAIPSEYYEQAINYICEYMTACEFVTEFSEQELVGKKVRYTIAKEELEHEMRDYEKSFLSGQKVQAKYLCINCKETIEEFGAGEEIIFPRGKRKIHCPKCSTGYQKKTERLILIQIEHRNILRQKCYEAAGFVPKNILELKPAYDYTIYDDEPARIIMEEDGSLVLEVCNHRAPLEKAQSIFFVGQKHTELEKILKTPLKARPDKFTYKLNRSQQIEREQIQIIEGCDPFSDEQYEMFQEIITRISDEKLLSNPILIRRNLSSIGGLLGYQKFMQEKSANLSNINRQLHEMTDLFMIAQTGVKSSYYGRQLEAQSQDCIFDLLKKEGFKVGLWTHGRVLSRLVKDPFLSSTIRVSNARSPLDALINQILRQFRFVINKIFRKIGLDPFSMGAGIFHRRKSSSDIDRKGLYFDLIESVGTLALYTILKAIAEGVLTGDDCYYTLDGSGHGIFRVKNSSLEKIERLVEEALNEQVFYNGKSLTFLESFEDNLLSFRKAIELWFEKLEENKTITSKEVIQCLKSANYSPFVYCPIECREELKISYDFATDNSFFFEGREEQVLAARKERNVNRALAKKKWRTTSGRRGKERIRLTKHQLKEQERSLIIALILMASGLQMDGYFGYYSTKQIRDILGLTQNQAQRILSQMVSQGLLVKMKHDLQSYYQLNLENETIHELLFTIGHIPSEDRVDELRKNSINVLLRMKQLLLKIQQQKHGLPVTVGWRGWKIPITVEQVFELISEQVKFSETSN